MLCLFLTRCACMLHSRLSFHQSLREWLQLLALLHRKAMVAAASPDQMEADLQVQACPLGLLWSSLSPWILLQLCIRTQDSYLERRQVCLSLESGVEFNVVISLRYCWLLDLIASLGFLSIVFLQLLFSGTKLTRNQNTFCWNFTRVRNPENESHAFSLRWKVSLLSY